jgi:hypothetical protein
MRTLVLILSLLLAGCAHHRRLPLPHNPEGAISLLQQEIALLERQLTELRRDRRVEFGERKQAMEKARQSYSQTQRDRDTRTIIEILERRKAALSAEFQAFHDGTVYDTF